MSPKKKNYNLPLVNVLVISLLLHVVAGLVVGSVVIARSFTEEEKEFKPPPKITKVEPKKIQYKQDVKKQQKDSAPPRPDPIQVPTPDNLSVPDISVDISGTSPNVEVGQGTGAGSGLGDGFEQSMSDFEMTDFGANQAAEGLLKGNFIDTKQTDDREPSDADYLEVLKEFVDSNNWEIDDFDDFYIADQEMFAAYWMTPTIEADKAPEAFNVQDEVEPKRWLAFYRGTANIKPGTYRIAGVIDDFVYIKVDGDIVFNGAGHWHRNKIGEMGNMFMEETEEAWERYGGELALYNTKMYFGEWFRVSRRQNTAEVEIILGEFPGGSFKMALYLQRKDDVDEVYESGKFEGYPKMPVFTTRALNSDQQDQIRERIQGEIPVYFE